MASERPGFVASSRDASVYDRPNVRTPKVVHVAEAAEWFATGQPLGGRTCTITALCSGVLLDETIAYRASARSLIESCRRWSLGSLLMVGRRPMADVIASYEVFAGTTAEGALDLDPESMTPDEMGVIVERGLEPYVSVCHQCAHSIDDPQLGDLMSFTVNGRSFDRQSDGTYKEYR